MTVVPPFPFSSPEVIAVLTLLLNVVLLALTARYKLISSLGVGKARV